MIVKGIKGLLHGADYNPEQWLSQKDTIWKQDMEYARLAGINSLSVGIFSWSHLEPEDGVYDFAWMDEVMDLLAENGMKAILATPSGARPPWLAEKYPSVLRMDNERRRRPYGARHNGCVSSPDFRRKVTEINARLAERYRNHPALGMWHVSNEYNNECHCPLCQEAFRQSLQERFGDIDGLNHAWWNSFWSHRYTSFAQVESPTAPSTLGEWESTGHVLAWKRFCSDHLIDFFRMEIEPLKRITPDVPVTTNMMGTFEGIDYFKLGRAMDAASWDSYPEWHGDERDEAVSELEAFKHDLMRGTGGQKPFLLMESSPSVVNWKQVNTLRAPGTILFQGLQAVAHGADSVQYFQFRASRGGSEQFHGAVINHSGRSDTRVFQEVAEVGRALEKLAPVAGSAARNRAALVYDWENRWALENAWFLHRGRQKYEETVLRHHAAMGACGVGVDVIDQCDALEGYQVVSAPMSFLLREGFAERLNAYVRGGGTLVLTYAGGYVDQNGLAFAGGAPDALAEAMGVRVEEIDAFDDGRPNHFEWCGKTYEIYEVAELASLNGSEALAGYARQFYAGKPCLTRHRFGDGECYYIAARTDSDFLRDFYCELLARAGVESPLTEWSPGVTAALRKDEEKSYLFLQNQKHEQGYAVLPQAMRDMLTGERLAGRVELAALSVRVLTEA